jgi:Domain of unknown function (DUF5710)
MPAPERIWLDVPFRENGMVKAAGGRWDPAARRWYAPRSRLPRLQGWVALPDLLPGEDREFGSGLFVDLIPSSCWFTNVRSCGPAGLGPAAANGVPPRRVSVRSVRCDQGPRHQGVAGGPRAVGLRRRAPRPNPHAIDMPVHDLPRGHPLRARYSAWPRGGGAPAAHGGQPMDAGRDGSARPKCVSDVGAALGVGVEPRSSHPDVGGRAVASTAGRVRSPSCCRSGSSEHSSPRVSIRFDVPERSRDGRLAAASLVSRPGRPRALSVVGRCGMDWARPQTPEIFGTAILNLNLATDPTDAVGHRKSTASVSRWSGRVPAPR